MLAQCSPSDIIIAIDGFAGCGKSTLAKDLSVTLGYTFIDTGAMYRAVTWYVLQQHIDVHQPLDWKQHLESLPFRYECANSNFRIFFNEKLLDSEIRSLEIAQHVSAIAAVPAIRAWLVRQQQQLGQTGCVVLDGRDIGTVVFPNAELKLFVTAEIEIRTQRRMTDLIHQGQTPDIDTVRQNLIDRDRLDSSRADSPLQPAPDSIWLDTSRMTRIDQLAIALQAARSKQNLKGNSGLTFLEH